MRFCSLTIKIEVMKKIILMLAVAGITLQGVEAQTTNSALKNKGCPTHVKKANTKKVVLAHRRRVHKDEVLVKTYQVCTGENGYYTCCVHDDITTVER
jgi:hypothetical protein